MGSWQHLELLFSRSTTMKKLEKNGIFVQLLTIGCNILSIAATNGFHQIPRPPLSTNVHSTLSTYCYGHQNGQWIWWVFVDVFLCDHGGCWGKSEHQMMLWWCHGCGCKPPLDAPHIHIGCIWSLWAPSYEWVHHSYSVILLVQVVTKVWKIG